MRSQRENQSTLIGSAAGDPHPADQRSQLSLDLPYHDHVVKREERRAILGPGLGLIQQRVTCYIERNFVNHSGQPEELDD